jgi:hypothetical protein
MMNKRDLKADLKFCNRATQGPWRHEWNPNCSEVYAPGVDTPIVLVGHDPHDAEFIVQAREGWPHAIERAIKAEELARELVETLEIFDTVNIDASLKERIEDAKKARAVLVKAKEVLGDD